MKRREAADLLFGGNKDKYDRYKNVMEGKQATSQKSLDKKKEYRESNKEHYKKYKKEYYEANKEHFKEYYETNKNKKKKYQKERYEANKDYYKKYKKEHYENNKEYYKDKKKERYEAKIQQALEDIRIIVEANPTKYDYIPGMNIYGIIYLVYNRITDRYYVGQTTKSFDIRYEKGFFKDHIDKRIEDERYNGPNELLQQDLELYGEESFEFNKLFKVASNLYELDKIEAYYIEHFNSYEAGYNRNRGNWFTNRGLEE